MLALPHGEVADLSFVVARAALALLFFVAEDEIEEVLVAAAAAAVEAEDLSAAPVEEEVQHFSAEAAAVVAEVEPRSFVAVAVEMDLELAPSPRSVVSVALLSLSPELEAAELVVLIRQPLSPQQSMTAMVVEEVQDSPPLEALLEADQAVLAVLVVAAFDHFSFVQQQTAIAAVRVARAQLLNFSVEKVAEAAASLRFV